MSLQREHVRSCGQRAERCSVCSTHGRAIGTCPPHVLFPGRRKTQRLARNPRRRIWMHINSPPPSQENGFQASCFWNGFSRLSSQGWTIKSVYPEERAERGSGGRMTRDPGDFWEQPHLSKCFSTSISFPTSHSSSVKPVAMCPFHRSGSRRLSSKSKGTSAAPAAKRSCLSCALLAICSSSPLL